MTSIEASLFVIVIKSVFIDKRGTKDTKGTVKLINLKQTDNAMDKNEKDNRKTIVHTTQHRKLKNKQREPHQHT